MEIAAAAVGSLVSSAAGSLFAKKDKPPPMPEVEKPTKMPDPMAQKARARRKASMLSNQQMGASNTVLTGGDSLG